MNGDGTKVKKLALLIPVKIFIIILNLAKNSHPDTDIQTNDRLPLW
jgi:hypothetical protein